MKIPSLAPRPEAEPSAAGVARPSAHGQATIRTASRRDRVPGGDRQQPACHGEGGAGQDGGDEQPADPVRYPLDGGLLRLGLLDQLIRCDSWVSRPTLSPGPPAAR